MTTNGQSVMWINEFNAATMTGLSVSTLRAHRFKRRGIPYVKIGKSVRYAIDDIAAYMEQHKISYAG